MMSAIEREKYGGMLQPKNVENYLIMSKTVHGNIGTIKDKQNSFINSNVENYRKLSGPKQKSSKH